MIRLMKCEFCGKLIEEIDKYSDKPKYKQFRFSLQAYNIAMGEVEHRFTYDICQECGDKVGSLLGKSKIISKLQK